jgi:hypothetical protein
MPTNFASLTVVNSVNESPTPMMNGMKKEMINATSVGSRKSQA